LSPFPLSNWYFGSIFGAKSVKRKKPPSERQGCTLAAQIGLQA
jgi:hypothetical protein